MPRAEVFFACCFAPLARKSALEMAELFSRLGVELSTGCRNSVRSADECVDDLNSRIALRAEFTKLAALMFDDLD
jgi:hypothetical protein